MWYLLICVSLVFGCANKTSARKKSSPEPAGIVEKPENAQKKPPSSPENKRPKTIAASDQINSDSDQNLQPPKKLKKIEFSKRSGPPMLVAIGGWNSCDKASDDDEKGPLGMNIYKPFKRMHEALEKTQQQEIPYLISCFEKTLGQVKFTSSNLNEKIISIKQDQLFSYINQLSKKNDSPVVLIGHSYGGWFALKWTESIRKTSSISMLVTVDAVSPIACTISTLSSLLLSKILATTTPSKGCNQFPLDISAAKQQSIKSKVKSWLNLYQYDLFNVLRAGSVKYADQNIRYKHDSIKDSINGHIEMGKSVDLWLRLGRIISDSL